MTKTTIKKLQRLRDMVEANNKGGNWWVNPNRHPLPTLPDQSYLEEDYIAAVEASSPHLAEKARELITCAGRERRG